MPRSKTGRPHSIAFWVDDFALPVDPRIHADARTNLISIAKLESDPAKADTMVRAVERVLAEANGLKFVIDERPRPAAIAVRLRELVRAARQFSRELGQQSDSGTEQAIETGRQLLRNLDEIDDPTYAELTRPVGDPPIPPVGPKLLEAVVNHTVSCLIRLDVGFVHAELVACAVGLFCTEAEAVARRLARIESRGRRGSHSREMLIAELTAIYRRYADPKPIEDLHPQRDEAIDALRWFLNYPEARRKPEAVLHPEQVVVDFINVALDAARIERPSKFRQCAKLVPR